MLLSQQQATHASISTFLGSHVARTPIALVVVCVFSAMFALISWRRPEAWLPWAAGLAAAVAMAVRAHGGHATATSTPILSQAEQWVHMLAGNFNGERTIKDPLTNQPFPNNTIPTTRIDPNALRPSMPVE